MMDGPMGDQILLNEWMGDTWMMDGPMGDQMIVQ